VTELRRRVERLEHLATNAASVSADANDLANFPGNKNLVQGTNITLTPGPGTLTISASGGGGGQAAIQFEDEGVALGAAGTVDTVDFVGAGVTATRVGDVVTVTIPGGGSVPTGTGFTHITSGVQDAAAKLVNLTAATDVAANQGTTTTVLHGNAAGQTSWGAVSLTADVTGDLPYANLVPATAASRILVRGSAGGAGDWQEGTLGTGLSFTGTVLNASIIPTPGSININIGAQPGVAAAVLVPQIVYLLVPANYALTGWEVACSPAATISVDVWYQTFPTLPTIANSITATNYITTTAAASNTGATGSWSTTAITRGNWLAISITANDLATYISLQLQGDKS